MQTLTVRQRERYRADGFVAFRLSDDDELVELRSVFDRVFVAARRRGKLVRESDDGALTLEKALLQGDDLASVSATRFYRRGSAIAGEILRAPAGTLIIAPFCIRKPGRAGVTAVHQHPPDGKPEGFVDGVTIWMTLDGVDVENGCMSFWPSSQRLGLLPRDARNAVAPEAIRHDKMVHVPLAPGGAVLLHDRVVHGALPNRARKARRALALYCMHVSRKHAAAASAAT